LNVRDSATGAVSAAMITKRFFLAEGSGPYEGLYLP